tara:strand:- start:198 stop:1157 length:960 start_codon:yes stop_codon:yes gene_type:complete
MHAILTVIFIGFVIILASCNSGQTTSNTVAETVTPVAKTIVRSESSPSIQATITPTPPLQATSSPTPLLQATPSPTPPLQATATGPRQRSTIRWNSDKNGDWMPNQTPPDCGSIEKLFQIFPLDVKALTQFARPGRSGDGNTIYIGHGSLRADNSIYSDVEVRFPAEGFSLAHVNRRLESYINSGEEQVKLEFIHPCGVLVRLDHLTGLSDRWASIIGKVPLLTDNSQITFLPQNVHYVDPGEILSAGIGHPTNTYLDFGVYDLRTKNNIASFIANDWPDYRGTADYGVCWSSFFGETVASILSNLPAGSNPSSDYCVN